MSLIEDLKAARDIVAERWCPVGLVDGNNVCVVGALNIATCGAIHIYGSGASKEELLRRNAAYDELRKHLPNPVMAVHYYNDLDTTTHQDVLNLFDKTLADLGGL